MFLSTQSASGSTVSLRSLEPEDVDRCYLWVNDPTIRPLLGGIFPMSHWAERKWLEEISATKRTGNPTDLVFGIVANEVLVGMTGLHAISLVHKHAVSGMIIGEAQYRGHGIGPVAKRLLIQFAFNELDIQVLVAYVMATNPRSIRMQEKCGYTHVGTIPQWFYKNGQRVDDLVFALTKEEWVKQHR